MNRSPRSALTVGAIALALLVAALLLLAPSGSRQQQGSTYSRDPSGYGAWYAFMQAQPAPLARWQQPFADLPAGDSPETFLRVYSTWQTVPLDPALEAGADLAAELAWVKAGNTLVLVGARGPVTAAQFRSQVPSSLGPVTIETRRRQPLAKEIVLGDRFGALVWQQTWGKGRIFYAATPYLAANAYQNSPGNFALLAQLVSQQPDGSPVARIWVDEYLHGYRDRVARQAEGKDSFWGYLTQTPLWPALVQGLLVLAIALWALNRRFGRPAVLPEPATNNSQAYIQALAEVLQKANSSDFVLATLGKAEQERLQQALGLGRRSVELPALLAAWQQQTGRSPRELQSLLQAAQRQHRPSETELLAWLHRWQVTPR